MGRRRKKGRNISGVLLLDKPKDMTSNKALQEVKHLFFAAKAGHTGALDPLATGMLPICLGEATKFSQFLLDSDKGYRVIGKLGVRTDSSDSTGEVVETKPVNVSKKQLLSALETFRGDIKQVPSMFSALKYQGKPLYTYARQGIEIEREARDISIYQLELIRFEDDEVELEIECSKGTYIRTIIDDLGQLLGCGAHVTLLHRTFVADYPVDDVISLDQLRADREQGLSLDDYLLPMDSPVMELEEAVIDQDSAHYFSQGQAINYPNLEQGELLRVYDEDDRFLGIAEVDSEEMLAPKRLVVYSE
ncbi:tRNA pseudouridine(55) synthase TruB [Aliikangiella marina]|uniref:tRNA pseudouridine synthase B n=1 Tax=Aliikangiella marina TaxID=1712262 RepID=A0A545TC92_9GAMM|nr:tRNA pseudouridine(55) synthase TruB [Aliikangiella marina]TQV74838.1 tRNA pseudouridine(55) synthase TruB [Aliikangiella marina]